VTAKILQQGCPEKAVDAPREIRYTFDDEMRKNLLENRMVLLTGEIGLTMAKDIVKELLYVSQRNTRPIKVILNSVGGEVYAGLLIYDTIRDLVGQGIQIEVEARGLAASMGAVILQAGSKRTASTATRFLIHEVSTWDWAKVSEMEEKVLEVRKVNDMLRDIIAVRSGHPKEEIDRLWTKKDVWFSAEEAKQFGLIDEVV
jgi:ATP-dependent Clp protease protease subunit